MLVSMLRTSSKAVDMTVYNTGAGVNYHPTMKGHKHRRYSYALKFKDLELEKDLLGTCFFDMIVGISIGQAKGEDYGPDYFYNNILSLFIGKVDKNLSKDARDYSIPQRSGNCYQKVVLAYIKNKLGHAKFKTLERAMKSAFLDYLMKEKFYSQSSLHAEIVHRGIINEARTALRLYSKNLLESAALETKITQLKVYQSAIGSFKVEHHSFIVSENQALDCFCSEQVKNVWNGKVTMGESFTPEYIDPTDLPDAILNKSEKLVNLISTKKVEHLSFDCFTFILTLPIPAVNMEDVYESFKIEQWDKLLEYLLKIAPHVSEYGTGAMSVVTAVKMFTLMWRFLTKRGHILANAELDLRVFDLIGHSSYALFYTPEMYQEYEDCLEYLRRASNQKSENPNLFSGLLDRNGTKFKFMPDDSAEYLYFQTIIRDNDLSGYLNQLSGPPMYSQGANCKTILIDDALKLSYLYMMKTDLVPHEFGVMRELLIYIHKASTEAKEQDSSALRGKIENSLNIPTGIWTSTRGFYDSFKCSSGSESISTVDLAYGRGSRKLEADKYGDSFENSIIVQYKQLHSTIEVDMDLIRFEPKRSMIYFALSCLSDYVFDIFNSDAYTAIITQAFFQGTALKSFKERNPLNGPLMFKKALDGAYSKLKKISILTGNEAALQRYLDLEYMISRWLGITLNRPSCTAQLIGSPCLAETVVTGPKPLHIKEAISHAMYPKDFVQKLLEHMKERLSKYAVDNESIRFDYPKLTFVAESVSYVYDYWTDELLTGTAIPAFRVQNDAVLKDHQDYEALLYKLRNTGQVETCGVKLVVRNINMFNRAVFKVVNDHYCHMVKLFDGPGRNFITSAYKDGEKLIYSLDFNFSLPEELAATSFLQFTETSDTLTFSDEDGSWVFGNESDVPQWMSIFIKSRPVIPLVNVHDPKLFKFIILNAFTMNFKPLMISSKEGVYYLNSSAVQLDHPLMKRYLGSLVIGDHALLPLSDSLIASENCPYQMIKVDNEGFLPGKRRNQLKLVLFFVIHGYYQEALRQLKDMVVTSQMTQYENGLLLKIAEQNIGTVSNNRPEMAAVAFYALYLHYVSQFYPATSKPKPVSNALKAVFKEFFAVSEENWGMILKNYYDNIGRMPAKFIVTDTEHRIGIAHDPGLISRYYEKQLQEKYGMTSDLRKTGDTWITTFKNKPFVNCLFYDPPAIEGNMGLLKFEVVNPHIFMMSIRDSDCLLHDVKDEDFLHLIPIMAIEPNNDIKRYVKSLIQAQKFGNNPKTATRQFLLMAAALRPNQISYIQRMVLQKSLNPEFEREIINEITTLYPRDDVIDCPKVANLPTKLSISNAPAATYKLSSIDLNYAEELSYKVFWEDEAINIRIVSINNQLLDLSKINFGISTQVKVFELIH